MTGTVTPVDQPSGSTPAIVHLELSGAEIRGGGFAAWPSPRLITRIAFGFHIPDALIALAVLGLSGRRPTCPPKRTRGCSIPSENPQDPPATANHLRHDQPVGPQIAQSCCFCWVGNPLKPSRLRSM